MKEYDEEVGGGEFEGQRLKEGPRGDENEDVYVG